MSHVATLRVCLSRFQQFIKVSDIPVQQVLTLLVVAMGNETPMADLADATGVGQSSVSRNVAILGQGINPREQGYGLLEAYEDPEFRRRKLVRLTAHGKELVKELEKPIGGKSNA